MPSPAPYYQHEGCTLYHGDAVAVLPEILDGSVDFVLADPPYPCINRAYGYWTEEEWFALMQPVVRECRRILTPQGSAVFILQPNSEKVGRMRPWLWDFLGWCCREWNVVQDHYWWNIAAQPTVHAQEVNGLSRSSVKPCVWVGEPDCYRNQSAVLWTESKANVARRAEVRYRPNGRMNRPSGHSVDAAKMTGAAARRGGVTPFNIHPIANTNSVSSAGAEGHGAGTPEALCDWWIRYACPPGGVVLDPFAGVATVGRTALRLKRRFVGIERDEGYCAIAARLLAGPVTPLFDTPPPVVQEPTLFD